MGPGARLEAENFAPRVRAYKIPNYVVSYSSLSDLTTKNHGPRVPLTSKRCKASAMEGVVCFGVEVCWVSVTNRKVSLWHWGGPFPLIRDCAWRA